jgi:hypothetical protein
VTRQENLYKKPPEKGGRVSGRHPGMPDSSQQKLSDRSKLFFRLILIGAMTAG